MMIVGHPLLSDDLLQTFRVCAPGSETRFDRFLVPGFPLISIISLVHCVNPCTVFDDGGVGQCCSSMELEQFDSSTVTDAAAKIRDLSFVILVRLVVFDCKRVHSQPVGPCSTRVAPRVRYCISHRRDVCISLAAESRM